MEGQDFLPVFPSEHSHKNFAHATGEGGLLGPFPGAVLKRLKGG